MCSQHPTFCMRSERSCGHPWPALCDAFAGQRALGTGTEDVEHNFTGCDTHPQWHLAKLELSQPASGVSAVLPYKSYISEGSGSAYLYPQSSYTYTIKVCIFARVHACLGVSLYKNRSASKCLSGWMVRLN